MRVLGADDALSARLLLKAALEKSGIEVSLAEDGEEALRQFHAQAFTCYSSLSYLKRLALNNLKVDQSFVRGLPSDREGLAIVKAIVSLAKNLGLSLTAEGVETLEQARLRSALACDTMQGYYISKPVAGADIPVLLSRQWSMPSAA